jgi:hypothetical protein
MLHAEEGVLVFGQGPEKQSGSAPWLRYYEDWIANQFMVVAREDHFVGKPEERP